MIHLLGFGAVGKLLAYTLRASGSPVTLLVRRPLPSTAAEYGFCIHRAFPLPPSSPSTLPRVSGFTIQHPTSTPSSASATRDIHTLIVCTKAQDAAPAVASLSSRLARDALVVVVCNGAGVGDGVRGVVKGSDVCVVEGITTHGVYVGDAETVVHAGEGTLLLSPSPHPSLLSLTSLLQPIHCTLAHTPKHFQDAQQAKLIVNAVINPLTALLDAPNAIILTQTQPSQLAALLTFDAVRLLCRGGESVGRLTMDDVERMSEYLREGVGGVGGVVGDGLAKVREVALATGRNLSSTVQDVRVGRPHELDFINGALVRRAQAIDPKIDTAVQAYILGCVQHRVQHGHPPDRWQDTLLDLATTRRNQG
ncbi:2-dehydropantoate 2-reductase (Ketopantoate reductase) (KPA reductase) (KPR) [Savitreella phatthalungensis]